MDLGPSDPLSFPIFTPLFGFSACTAPEMQADVIEINEGNWYFTRKVLKRANISPITLQRGTRYYDSDFWRWMLAGVTGDTAGFDIGIPLLRVGGPTYRRDLLLIQYFSKFTLGTNFLESLAATAATAIGASIATGLAEQGAIATANLLGLTGATALLSEATGLNLNIGPADLVARVPAKMWLLHDCIPIRYKASGDFDAASSAVSVAELDLACEYFEEIALSA
jgi:phage tail-like protein